MKMQVAPAYLLLATVLSAGAFAVQSAQAASAERNSTERAKVSDKDLKAFAKVYVEYHRIKQSYEPKLQAMKEGKEKQKIKREGDDKVRRVLEEQGLSPERYNQLFAAVNRNPRLREKALELIQQERRKS